MELYTRTTRASFHNIFDKIRTMYQEADLDSTTGSSCLHGECRKAMTAGGRGTRSCGKRGRGAGGGAAREVDAQRPHPRFALRLPAAMMTLAAARVVLLLLLVAGARGTARETESCASNSECSPSLACMRAECTNPCVGSCGLNARCDVADHLPVCTCPEGASGNPYFQCFPIDGVLHKRSVPAIPFVSLNDELGGISNVAESLEKAFESMASSKKCTPVLPITARTVLAQLKLYFFYGSSIADRQVVTLHEATKLLNNMRWKRELPIAVYISGWLHTPTISYTREVIKAHHVNGSYNLLVVDWQDAARLEYSMAVTMVPRVGQQVAQAVQSLLDAGARLGVVVGHSLGAHVAGHFARNLRRRPPFVVALDPAGPLFYSTMFQCQEPISSMDADYVVALHTDWNRLGSNELTGPVDFMPNGGHRLQPGCSALDNDSFGPLCSHTRAIFLWCDVLRNWESLIGRHCASWNLYKNGQCSNNFVLSLSSRTDQTGIFDLNTNDRFPYGRGKSGV